MSYRDDKPKFQPKDEVITLYTYNLWEEEALTHNAIVRGRSKPRDNDAEYYYNIDIVVKTDGSLARFIYQNMGRVPQSWLKKKYE